MNTAESSKPRIVIVGRGVAGLRAKGDMSIFALSDCASFVPGGSSGPMPPTAQVANQQALRLIRHLPAWFDEGTAVPPFHFRDLTALVSLSDYNAFRTLGRLGVFSRTSSTGSSPD